MAETAGAAALPDFDKLWDFNDPAASERRFAQLIPAAQTAGDRSYLLQLLTQVARAQGLQAKFDDAHATLNRVREDLDETLALARVRYLLERGRVFNSSGRPAAGMPLFEQAWHLAESAGVMRYAVDALHMIAIAAPTPEERLRWNERCLEVIARHPDQAGWLPAVYNNLGEACRAIGDYQRSLDCFQRILEIDRAKGREPWLYNRIDEARLLRLVGRPAEALSRIEAIAATLKEPNGFLEEEWGESLVAVGREAEGRAHSLKAWALLQKEGWVAEQEPGRWERLRGMAGGTGA